MAGSAGRDTHKKIRVSFPVSDFFCSLANMEYRMSGGSKAVVYVFGAAAFGLGIFGIYMAFHLRNPGLLFPAAFGIGIGWLMYRMGSRLLLTIDENSITLCDGFTTKSVLLDEIAGFRSGTKEGLVLVKKSGEKPLTLPGNIERRSELRDWVKERYPDIDAKLAEEVTEEVLHNERYGLTEEDRGFRLKQARRIAGAGWIVAGALFVLLFIAQWAFEWLILLALVFPLAAVYLTWYYKGILRLYTTRAKPYPSLGWSVFIAEVAAWIVTDKLYSIYFMDGRFWGIVVALSVAVMLVWSAACRVAVAGEKYAFAIYCGLLLAAGLYSYTALVFTNCAYDHQRAETFRVEISGKHLTGGRRTSYYLELSPWGSYTNGSDYIVSRRAYQSVKIGDSVRVYLHPGKWGIPWYDVFTN
jgi:hypothetical protein